MAADTVGAFNERIAKLGANPEFQNDHLAREETAVVLDQIHDDLDTNNQAVYSEVHKYLPELAEPVRLHDGDMVSGLEYNNGHLAFHGDRFGTLVHATLARVALCTSKQNRCLQSRREML